MNDKTAVFEANLKLPAGFDDRSRIWFYTANRDLTESEIDFIQEKLAIFIPNWTAHNNRLKAFGQVFFNRVLLIMVDETQAGVSGCGIDKSVQFVENTGKQLGIDFFNRMIIGTKQNDTIEFMPLNLFVEKIKNGELATHTLVLDTLLTSKQEFDKYLFRPANSTWLKRFV